MSGKALLDHFSALDNSCQSGKVVYLLPEIMLLVLCATLAAAEDFVEVLDVVFHDDLMRLRTASGPQNMSIIKHMAMNLIRTASGKDSLKTRRKAAAWSHDYLRTILTQTA